MKELIEQIKLKADSIPTNTKENRMIKGAYVDCLIMVKEASKNIVTADVSGCGDMENASKEFYAKLNETGESSEDVC